MPKLKEGQLPKYRLHKQSGQAIVTLSGRTSYSASTGSAARAAAATIATRSARYVGCTGRRARPTSGRWS
jgi:hypothetical protein